jgi:xanthine/uracil permease
MKTKALTYTLIASGIAAVAWLLFSARVNVDVGTVLGWSTAAVLLAMVPMDYRLTWKRLFGR